MGSRRPETDREVAAAGEAQYRPLALYVRHFAGHGRRRVRRAPSSLIQSRPEPRRLGFAVPKQGIEE